MAKWAAAGMSMLPGMAPRPQHHICDKKDHTENIESNSNALFVFVRNCENIKVNIHGKIGKVTLEQVKNIEITLDNRIVSGTLEVIKCQDVAINLNAEAEVPTFQVDDSLNVSIDIERRSQIEKVYFIRCNGLKLLLNASNDGDRMTDQALQYDIPTAADRSQVQQIAHWSAASVDAQFVTETVVRDGIYPTTAEMKKAADQRQAKVMEKMAGMLADDICLEKPESKSASNKDEFLDLPD